MAGLCESAVCEQAGCGQMAGEHEVRSGRQRGQSPLSRNLAGEGNKVRGTELKGEVGRREFFCLFLFRRQSTEICFSLREKSLWKEREAKKSGGERNEEKI